MGKIAEILVWVERYSEHNEHTNATTISATNGYPVARLPEGLERMTAW
jgi:hypothetical protein